MTATLTFPAAPGYDRAPLGETIARVDAAVDWCGIRLGVPGREAGTVWTRCADVDAAHLQRWEARIAGSLVRNHGRSHPMTTAGFALDWYAGIPGQVGGASFRLARRVPRLGRAALAFACHPDEHYPDRLALLDDRFWCLPDDPDAAHRCATVVADDDALAAVLRAQVRAHADDFLAGYRPATRLPRRGLLGSFFDGLDTGVWFGGDPGAGDAPRMLADAATVLPGGTAQFREPSSLYHFTDVRDREHVSRRRVGCCYYFKVSDGGLACSTCPRVDDAERTQRYSEMEQ